MRARTRLAATVFAATVAVSGAATLLGDGAAAARPPASPAEAVGAATQAASTARAVHPAASSQTYHYLRSGFVTVNGDGQEVRFSTTNGLSQGLTIYLSLVDPKGATVASSKGIVGPDKSLTLSFDPGKTTRVRAVFLTIGDAGLVCNAFAPDLELLGFTGGVFRSVEVLDTFWHVDVTV